MFLYLHKKKGIVDDYKFIKKIFYRILLKLEINKFNRDFNKKSLSYDEILNFFYYMVNNKYIRVVKNNEIIDCIILKPNMFTNVSEYDSILFKKLDSNLNILETIKLTFSYPNIIEIILDDNVKYFKVVTEFNSIYNTNNNENVNNKIKEYMTIIFNNNINGGI